MSNTDLGALVGKQLSTRSRDGKHPVQVSVPDFYIKLETPLHAGSSNDGSGKATSKRMLVDGDYVFRVMSRNPSIKLPDLGWEVIYTSPTMSKTITRRVVVQPGTYSDGIWTVLNLLGQFGDAATDMCGTTIIVRAYCKDNPPRKADLDVPVHNRFYWFDAIRVQKQIEERVKEPWRIDQGQNGLCGVAATYYMMIKRNQAGHHEPSYEKLAKELHRTGVYKVGSYRIKPSSSMYDVNPGYPVDLRYQEAKMWEADWIVLAGTRSGDSILGYDGLEHGDGLQGFINRQTVGLSAGDVVSLIKKVTGYSSVHSWSTTKLIPLSETETLMSIDDKYKQGKSQFALEIDDRMFQGKTDKSFLDSSWTSNHWVVYAGGLDLSTPGTIKFKVFTWGRNPDTGKYYKPYDDVNLQGPDTNLNIIEMRTGVYLKSFTDNFYGYVEGDY